MYKLSVDVPKAILQSQMSICPSVMKTPLPLRIMPISHYANQTPFLPPPFSLSEL